MKSKLQNIREKESKVSNQLFEDAAKLRDKEKAFFKFKGPEILQENEENTIVKIDSEAVADVVSSMTGIPVVL